jgi:ABC-type transport system involved in cytochrome c biogenesis permease component
MKSSLTLLVVIATLLTTALFFSFVGSMFSDYTIEEVLKSDGLVLSMIFLSWIPTAIVGTEFREYLDKI